ncbi:MAG: 3-hydroxyacyl-ACP dehydratase FabZ [Synergistetes bacterium]|nr:3-hydroxyacyl-ACP dehydratase FabZ [Synergistota bacterium]
MKVLPHRYPFLLVDRILEIEEGRVVGVKNVTINEPFFQGHFPGEPVMPGVLVLEAMGQVAAVMIINREELKGKFTYLVGLDKVRFRKPVLPGDQLVTEAWVKRVKKNMGIVEARGTVNGEVVAEATFLFVIRERLVEEKEAYEQEDRP